MTKQAAHPRRIARYFTVILVCALAYVLSSGPVLAAAFWLRESTHWDGFYAVMWVYYPLLAIPQRLLWAYIGWWCWLFGAVPPG
jgi:hypothetical protein